MADYLSALREAADNTMNRVLIIEDDPRHWELMTALLDATRYEVRAAESARRGLRAAVEDPPDLILLDLCLPDLDGCAVCRQLRQEPRTQQVPVVIVTASDGPALNRLTYWFSCRAES